jgi:YVTN family beta-propeller protein
MSTQNRGVKPRRFFLGAVSLALLALLMISSLRPTSAAAEPKAYVGLFKDNAVAVIDTSTNQVLSKIAVPKGPHGLVITPDGRTVYVSSDGDTKVSVIDTATDTIQASIEVGKTPQGLTLTPDGKQLLVSVFGAGQVVFVDTSTNKVIGQVAVPSPHNTAVSPDGKVAYVVANYAADANTPITLTILDLESRSQIGTVKLTKIARTLNFSPDGKMIYFTQAGVDAVQVLDPTSNQIGTEIPVGASPHLVMFSASGEYGLVVSQKTNELSILDHDTNKVIATVAVGRMPHWIALTDDDKWAYVTNEASNDVSVVDLEAKKVVTTIAVGAAPRKIAIQPALISGSAMSTSAATQSH